MNKTVQDLKMEIEVIKKTTSGNPGDGDSRKENRNYRHKHQQQNIGDRRECQV